ncbi:hypothetical protein [Cupriavidus oxalaticus]|uniref:hypothetical protein n=1 Tax=Cupriavidus oxalaticus TaxID=96344 RepID=UPI0031713BDC
MTTSHILCLAIGAIIGGAVGMFATCLVAAGRIGEDPLPEIQPERVRQYQD